MNGFLLIDKESGVTSFDVVRQVRHIMGEKKVGHSGTLDPLATGLLLIALGEGTKLLEYLIGCDKKYEVVAKFGAVSDTYDAEGTILASNADFSLSREGIEDAIKSNFLGKIEQIPPKYSALKIKGKRACDLVREGKEVEMKGRNVKILSFDVLEVSEKSAKFVVECGSGTYIRSLVHDLGQVLGCGAYVAELRRTKIGNFSIENAVNLEVLDKKVEQALVSMEEVGKSFSYLDLTDDEFEGLKDGRVLLGKKLEQEPPLMAFYRGKLIGVLQDSSSGIKLSKVIHG